MEMIPQTRCNSCSFALNSPIRLQCGHTFCEICISMMPGRCLIDDVALSTSLVPEKSVVRFGEVTSKLDPMRPPVWKSGRKRDSWCPRDSPCSRCKKFLQSQTDAAIKDPKKPCEWRDGNPA